MPRKLWVTPLTFKRILDEQTVYQSIWLLSFALNIHSFLSLNPLMSLISVDMDQECSVKSLAGRQQGDTTMTPCVTSGGAEEVRVECSTRESKLRDRDRPICPSWFQTLPLCRAPPPRGLVGTGTSCSYLLCFCLVFWISGKVHSSWIPGLCFPVGRQTVWMRVQQNRRENPDVLVKLTSVKLQDTARPFLSTWGRRITSFPAWNNTSEGSCLDKGDVETLYLQGRIQSFSASN